MSNLGFELRSKLAGCTFNLQPANLHNIVSHRKAYHAEAYKFGDVPIEGVRIFHEVMIKYFIFF